MGFFNFYALSSQTHSAGISHEIHENTKKIVAFKKTPRCTSVYALYRVYGLDFRLKYLAYR